jgi:Tfp pilus assembly protein PilZ
VEFVGLRDNGEHLSRGMGRTRYVSEGGLLLQTYRPLQPEQKVLISVGLGDDLIELRGRIVHLHPPVPPSSKDRFCSGIELTEIDQKGKRLLKKYIEALNDSKGEPSP